MKKLLALALALMMMLCCVPALAASDGYVDYQHPTLGYTLEYPNTWLALDSANIETLMNSMKDTEAAASLNLSAITPQITQLGMTMFIDLFSGTNINVVAQDVGMNITPEQFLPMMPQLAAQLVATFADATLLDEGSLYEVGGKQYCTISVSYLLNGQTNYVFQFYTFSGSTMYLVTLTTAETVSDLDAIEAYTDHLLETLVPAA